MDTKKPLSKPTKDPLTFLDTLPGVRNVRAYTYEEQLKLDLKTETPAVRRSIIRLKNTKSGR
jgi:hypothetical protein